MDEPEVKVEHHWHEPSQGQVTKALYQYIADQGINQETLNKLIESKLQKVLSEKIDRLLAGYQDQRPFDKLIVEAVAAHCLGQKKNFDSGTGYGYTNHLRSLIERELQRLVVSNYEITVKEKQGAKQ